MNDRFSWTANFGRWKDVALQVHLIFFLFAAAVFFVEWHHLEGHGTPAGTGLVTILVVLISAIAHELSHGFAASTLGGNLRNLVVTPWGGPSDLQMPADPREAFIVSAAGPFFNAMVFAIGAFLLISTDKSSLTRLIDPSNPFAFRYGDQMEISLIQIATWVNFQMLAVNMMPAFPFDGSRLLRSALLIISPRKSTLQVENRVLVVGIMTGLGMFVLAYLVRDYNYGDFQPTWFYLVVAGILLIFGSRYGYFLRVLEAHQELQLLDQYMNYEICDEAENNETWMTEFEEDTIAEWIHDQENRKEIAEQSVAIDEETRVDAILKKLHESGRDALSEEEKAFLNRVSQQYRKRRELRS